MNSAQRLASCWNKSWTAKATNPTVAMAKTAEAKAVTPTTRVRTAEVMFNTIQLWEWIGLVA